MKLDVEKREGLHRLLTVHIPAQEMAQTYNNAWQAARSTKLRGFRQGKFPKGFLEKQFRGRVESELYNQLIPKILQESEKQYHLNRVTQAQIEELQFDRKQPLECKMTFEVRPEFPDLDLTQIEVETPSIEVSEDEKKEQLESILQEFGSYQDKKEAIGLGDFVTLDWTRKEDDEVDVQEDQFIKVGSSLPEEIRKNLIGMKENEQKEFAFKQGESNVDLSLTVKKVQFLELPELTEDILAKLNVKNAEELEQSVQQKIYQDKEREARKSAYQTLRERLGEIYKETAIPETPVKQHKESLQRENTPANAAQDIEKELDKFQQSLRVKYALEDLFEKQKLALHQERCEQLFVNLCYMYGQQPDEFIKTERGLSTYFSIQNSVREEVALDFILDQKWDSAFHTASFAKTAQDI